MNAKEVKEIRKELNLSQEEFAKLIGVSKNTVYNYENGSTIPASKVAILLQLKNKKGLVLNEPPAIHETPMDKKIAENEEKIKEAKAEIAKWEQKISEKPENTEEYEIYIAGYEKQIFLLNKIINTTLEVKIDYLKRNKK